MLGPGICGYSSASMCIQSLKPHGTLSWRKPEPPRLSLPGGLNVTQRCENPPGPQVSTPIWSLWATWPVMTLCQLKPTSWRRVAASSSSHQGNLLAIQATNLQAATRCPAGELQQQLSCKAQQNHEGRSHKSARRFHRTANCTPTSFFPLSTDG